MLKLFFNIKWNSKTAEYLFSTGTINAFFRILYVINFEYPYRQKDSLYKLLKSYKKNWKKKSDKIDNQSLLIEVSLYFY